MSYIVFDLEFNQGSNSEKAINITNPRCPFEIIEIGAIKLNKNLQIISTFHKLIKPVIYNDINPFVSKITGITSETLIGANTFKEIYKEFLQFIGENMNVLGVWGVADIKELFRNIKYHELNPYLIPKEYINIQSYASKYLTCPKGTNIGLSNAVELFGIPLEYEFHNAINDAYYTAQVFNRIYNKKMKPKIYNIDENRNQNRYTSKKTEIQTDKLFKQFEKMFNREMTKEEKSIIRLAYMMGKTNQFQVNKSSESKE